MNPTHAIKMIDDGSKCKRYWQSSVHASLTLYRSGKYDKVKLTQYRITYLRP